MPGLARVGYSASMPLCQRLLTSGGIACLALTLACGDDVDPDDGPPCGDDLNGCSDDTSMFMEVPECELTGELDVVMGQGETVFQELAEGDLPDPEFGFQGGQHVWMAVQVRNPAVDYPQLKIRINVDYCETSCSQPENWLTDNVRELLADETTMTVTPEGYFEQTRMLVTVFGWVTTPNRRVEMLVTDPCGRQGYVKREYVSPGP